MMRHLRRVRLAALGLAALVLTACGGPRADEVVQWGQAVTAARDQSDLAFSAVNALVRERQISFAATQPNLNESLFHPGLTLESVGAWRASLDTLSAYADALARLLDEKAVAGVGDSASTLAQALAARARLDAFQERPGLAGAITKIGNAVAAAAARATAQEIMADADPGVQDLLAHMALMLSEVDDDGIETGVVASVTTNWGVRLAETQAAFLGQGADKAAVATRYAGDLDRRNASIATLRTLKSALDKLGASHGRLAAGAPAGTATVIAELHEYSKLAKAVLEDLNKQPAGAK